MYQPWPDEPLLIAAWRIHDPHTLDTLISNHSSDLLAWISLILNGVGSVGDAQECLNDLLVAVWQEIASFNPARSTLQTWLARRARDIALARRRTLRGYPG